MAKLQQAGDARGAVASGAAPCLMPSFADACRFADAPYSCLVLETSRRHVALSPMYLKKKKTGIREQLNGELLRYSESMHGVPMAYDDIKVLGQHGDIMDDQGFIHMNVEASFVIFQPKRGQKLLGVINKVGTGHVGCLVHNCFNASIAKPHHVSPEAWREAGFTVGNTLEFEVSQLDADVAGVLLIRGRLPKNRVEELLAHGTQEDAAKDSVDGVKIKTKKKKEKFHDEEDLPDAQVVEESPADTGEIPEATGTTEVNGRVHGKRKSKRRKGDEEQELTNTVLAGCPSKEHGDSEPRKRKRAKDERVDLDADSEPHKKKKKKKV